MKLVNRDVTMTCSLELTERETKMLARLTSFDAKQLAESIYKNMTHDFSQQEWEVFWEALRVELAAIHDRFHDTRKVFAAGEKKTI